MYLDPSSGQLLGMWQGIGRDILMFGVGDIDYYNEEQLHRDVPLA